MNKTEQTERLEARGRIKTRVLILSDTHGLTLDGLIPLQPVDVAIHCGDLTQESKIDEFRATLRLLRSIEAPLKLVIAGNHDFTLDTPTFREKVEQAQLSQEPELVRKTYGDFGEAESLFHREHEHGVRLLGEGTHHFVLKNGAELTLYASPYTPSSGRWGFSYTPDQGHAFDIKEGTDIIVTHGPPRGVLDRTGSRERAGSQELFAAVARAKPLLHCFGHIHEGWGARLVSWRKELSQNPSHLTDIDNEKSTTIELLSTLCQGKFDDPETVAIKTEKLRAYTGQKYCYTSHCLSNMTSTSPAGQTLFVNAAIQGDDEMQTHLSWLVDLALPMASTANR